MRLSLELGRRAKARGVSAAPQARRQGSWRGHLPCHLSCSAQPNAICSAPHSLCFLSFWFQLDEPKACHKPEEGGNKARSHRHPAAAHHLPTRIRTQRLSSKALELVMHFYSVVTSGGSKSPVPPYGPVNYQGLTPTSLRQADFLLPFQAGPHQLEAESRCSAVRAGPRAPMSLSGPFFHPR